MARHWATNAVSSLPRLALYASLPDEMSTRPLCDRAGRLGRRILWPRIEAGGMVFAACSRWEDLVPGRYWVLQQGRAADEKGRSLHNAALQ